MEETTIPVPSAPLEGEPHEAWLARTLREAFVKGHGLTVECNIEISPEHVKRLVAPAVDDSMFFAAITTADMTRSSVINLLFKTLVCLHPEKFPPSGDTSAQAVEADQPAGAAEAAPDPAGDNVVPLTTHH